MWLRPSDCPSSDRRSMCSRRPTSGSRPFVACVRLREAAIDFTTPWVVERTGQRLLRAGSRAIGLALGVMSGSSKKDARNGTKKISGIFQNPWIIFQPRRKVPKIPQVLKARRFFCHTSIYIYILYIYIYIYCTPPPIRTLCVLYTVNYSVLVICWTYLI